MHPHVFLGAKVYLLIFVAVIYKSVCSKYC